MYNWLTVTGIVNIFIHHDALYRAIFLCYNVLHAKAGDQKDQPGFP